MSLSKSLDVKEIYMNFKKSRFLDDSDIITYAIKINNIELLNLVITSDNNNIYNSYIILSIFNNKNIEFLKLLKIKYKLKEWISALFYIGHKDRFFVLNFLIQNVKIKNVVRVAKRFGFIKTIKFKTKNNYIKGYNKN